MHQCYSASRNVFWCLCVAVSAEVSASTAIASVAGVHVCYSSAMLTTFVVLKPLEAGSLARKPAPSNGVVQVLNMSNSKHTEICAVDVASS